MRILIADGGTGGHIFPAIAVADELKGRKEVEAILFTGTQAGLESGILPRYNYELRLIKVGGLIGKGLAFKMKTLMQLPFAFLDAGKILREFRPQVVIGFGAYASGPVLVAAATKRIPILLVEPNAVPGFTNRIALRFAKKVAVPFEDSGRTFRGKGVVTGVPVRPLKKQDSATEKFTVGVFCGSQGSRHINDMILSALPELAKLHDRIHLIHQTGNNDFERIEGQYKNLAPFFEVIPFINDVEKFYNRCGILVCRAGAITLAELTIMGKPALLVPLPTATHNHQEQNARRLQAAGAARMILQKDFTPELLLTEIRSLLEHPESLAKMEEAALKMGKPDAARTVADLAMGLTG